MEFTLRFVGAGAIMLYVTSGQRDNITAFIGALADALEGSLGEELVDLVPSYTSLLVIYDPLHQTHVAMARDVRRIARSLEDVMQSAGKSIALPVYYAVEAGEDLERLAENAALSIETVIALHSEQEYRVNAIGFAPGFAYLGEVDARIACPRLSTPRLRVPCGSVAIADRQTAVYPATSPGGWNLIGRCPVPMFDPSTPPHMPVAVGDRVRFEPIDRAQFLRLGGTLT